MSGKKQDKIGLLASLRRQATESEHQAPPALREPPPVPMPEPIGSSSSPVLVGRPVPLPSNNGAWLERTSITLKTPDREALRTLTLLLVQQGRQHVQTSTVIQAALHFTAAHLEGRTEEFLAAFENVRRADRRKSI